MSRMLKGFWVAVVLAVLLLAASGVRASDGEECYDCFQSFWAWVKCVNHKLLSGFGSHCLETDTGGKAG